MDRQFAYTGALPQNTDVLSTNKNMLYGLGYLAQATLGTGTSVTGLVGAQSTVPDLHISIGPGAIHSLQTVDATAYGDLGTDANTIVKQGLLKAAQTLTLTAPTTSGYSQVYLVEAAYQDVDGGATVLPYFNSSNPIAPYSGPDNAGTSNYTVRQGVCTITLNAGAAAPTGSQVTPSTDAGYVPLYTITLANGQTAITTAQIVLASGAPFISRNLGNSALTGASIITYSTAGTLSFTASISSWHFIEVYGGGGGGAVYTGGGETEGGGGGGSAEGWVYLTAGQTVTVTVGAAGANSGSTAAGLSGGTSSFGAYMSATGGQGANISGVGAPGVGGVGSGGQINLTGQSGGDGLVNGTSGLQVGMGGAASGPHGGKGGQSSATGASWPGGGGTVVCVSNAFSYSSSPAAGGVIVRY